MKAPATVSTDRSSVIAALRASAFLGLTVAMIPVHMLCSALRPNRPFLVPQFFHRVLLKILGFQVRTHGTVAATTAQPVLFVANHSSYLDIPVLGSLLPAAFIAKAEVADWPLFGYMAKLQHTVFIERKAARAEAQKDGLRRLLAEGRSLILFPEGTSSDGLRVLPFKSSLFSVMETNDQKQPIVIQPVSVACTALDGLPMTRALRPFFAWYGDMTLLPHLWSVFKFGRFTIDVIFHPPVSPENFKNRKELSAYCQEQIARGIEHCLAGRRLTPIPVPLLPAPRERV